MIRREGDYQKRAVGGDRLMIPREHTTYAQMAARQSQQQRTRNADALARARSARPPFGQSKRRVLNLLQRRLTWLERGLGGLPPHG